MKTLKITITTTATFLMLFLFTSSVFAQLEFQGLYLQGEGGAGWDADGSGPEPYGNGHDNKFYYVASRDYVDTTATSGGHMTNINNGFTLFEQALSDNGFSIDQVTLKFALADLGDDTEGIDYFSIGDMEYCNFYPMVITIELDGEALVEAIGNYSMYISGPGVREFESGYLKINNISGSSIEPVKNVANAFLEDIDTEELQFEMTISPDNVAALYGNGRSGAYIDVVCIFEKGLPEIPFSSSNDHEGFAGWDADGTGLEPYGNGNSGNQFYYGASLDYDNLDLDPNACLGHFLDGQKGFLNTILQLQYRGYEIGDLKLKLGLNSLGPDVEGEDWGDDWNNYYNNVITLELNNEPVVSVLCDTNVLVYNNGWSNQSSIGLVYNISENTSPDGQFVAQSFVKDLGTHFLELISSNITYDSSFVANGRDGAIYQITSGKIKAIHEQATFIPEGPVSGTWTVENSPYYIEGPVTVENGQTLEIKPGVRFAVRGAYPITVEGCVNAIDTTDAPIMFSASNPNITWDGFDFDGTSTNNDPSVFDHCIFQYGRAQGGSEYNSGGIFALRNYDQLEIHNSVFRNNIAEIDGTYPPSGGAISLWNASPIIQNCTFYDNTAKYGGAVMCYTGSNPEISRNLFYNNTAQNDGGAIQIWENSNPDIINNTFSLNNAGNNGGAIDVYSNSDPVFINNILWGNEAVNAGQQISISSGDCDISLKYSDVEGGEAGIGPYGIQSGVYENNIDEDPLFVDPMSWDFNLILGSSPCIDAGDPTMPDPDGTAPEMGCYYYPYVGFPNNQHILDPCLVCYPNPSSSTINIVYDSYKNEEATMEVFNFIGQKVEEFKISNQIGNEIHLDISNFRIGTYFCKLTVDSKVYSGKFIKN